MGGICSRRLDGQLTVSSNMNERKKKKRRDSLTDQLVRSPSPSRKASLTKRKKGNLWNIYDKLSNIGSGITGYVLRVKERNTGTLFACKVVDTEKVNKDLLNKEIELLKLLDHPNVIHLREIWKQDSCSMVHLVMELAAGPDLYLDLKTAQFYQEDIAAHIFIDALQAVRYVHSMGIVHRDLKLSNFVFARPYENRKEFPPPLKLIDFGFSESFIGKSSMKQVVGTSYFLAPEIAKECGYDERCDMWSMGVILYMILCGEAPFFGKTDEEIVEKAMQCVYDFSHPQWNHVSERVKHLIEKLLVVESDERLTSREAFEHPWVQKKRVMQASSPSSLKMKDCFVSIEKYATLDPFRKMVFAMIVFYETSQKLDNFRDLFKEVDRDGNGTIDIIEFRNAYLEFFERSGSRGDFLDEESREEHMQRLFRALDVDNSGTISYSDFVVGSLGSVVEIDNVTLRKVFEALDADNAGTVTGEKIKAFITMEKGPYSEKQIEEIVKNAKVLNKTGSMKFKDLRELMRNDGIPMSP